MPANLFHVFRNTPLGRETLLQSIYFCQTLDLELTVYIPDAVRFKMVFDHDAVQVDLDQSYLSAPDTAMERVRALAADAGLTPNFLHPLNRTAGDLADIPSRRPHLFDGGEFSHNLYDLPHDALVLSGAYGHGLINNLLLGSKMEIAQNVLTNAMLVSGPRAAIQLN